MKKGIVKNKDSIYILIVLLISSTMMLAISMNIYFKISKPEFYKTFIELGNKFLNEAKYEEAILEFEKAIHIEPKSTEARIGNGKGYIGINEVDNAVEEFKEAQNIDIENTKLLLEILEILKDIDSEIAYDILQNYIDKTQNTIPNTIQEIINNSNDKPEIPIINPVPGTYINPTSVKLEQEKLIVGHTFYYTLDGSEPSKESIKYSGGIEIKEDATIKLIAYNPKDEASEVITLEYFIDTEILNKLNELIKECEELNKNTEEGTKIGNCIKGSKVKFQKIIETSKNSLNKQYISYEVASKIYDDLNNALNEFRDNIIEKTDKDSLKDTIDKAQQIYNQSSEGNGDGQYKVGSKSKLLSEIKEAQNVYDDILSKQDDIDNKNYELNQAIKTFKNSLIKNITKEEATSKLFKYITKSKPEIQNPLSVFEDEIEYTTVNGIRGYKIIVSESSETHMSYIGTYIVEESTGDIYEEGISSGVLSLVSK